jgi:hypothetical protein
LAFIGRGIIMADNIWACHLCQSNVKQISCCGRKVCEFSLFHTTKIEEMFQHMITFHGEKRPPEWKNPNNKIKLKRKKKKRKIKQ